MSSPNNNNKRKNDAALKKKSPPNWTYRTMTRTVKGKNGKNKVETFKQLLYKGQVATRKGVRRGKRGERRDKNKNGKVTITKIGKRVTLPGNVNSKAGRVSYKALRNKAINLGLKVNVPENWKKFQKAVFVSPEPVRLRLTRKELVNAILSKNLPKFVPKERKERSNKEKAATKKARANRAKAKRATIAKAKKALGARRNLAARLKAAAEKAKAANAAAAAANAEVAKLQAQVAQSAKRKAVEEVNANKNRAVKRVKVARQLKKLGLSQNNINKRLRNQGLL